MSALDKTGLRQDFRFQLLMQAITSLLSIFSPSKYSLNNLLGALRNYKSKVGIQDKSLKSKFDVPDWKTCLRRGIHEE